jgi:hypothetical protein
VLYYRRYCHIDISITSDGEKNGLAKCQNNEFKWPLIVQILYLTEYLWKMTKDRCSPHLQKIERLDFSLREHEGEVK